MNLATNLALLFALSLETAAQETPFYDLSELCDTPARPIEAFEFEVLGNSYFIPSNSTVKKNGVTIYRGANPQKWDLSRMGMYYLVRDGYLFLEMSQSDCVDIDETRYFVNPNQTDYLLELNISGHSYSKDFFEYDGKLYFWTEWFCLPQNPQVKELGKYVMALDESFIHFTPRHFPHLKEGCMPAEMSKASNADFKVPNVVK